MTLMTAPVLYPIGFISSASASRQAPACCAYVHLTVFLAAAGIVLCTIKRCRAIPSSTSGESKLCSPLLITKQHPRRLQTIFLLRRYLYCNTHPHLISLFEFPQRRQQLPPSVSLSFNDM
ncbi:uncharacterized protein LACBIDRAFT_296219 [Laccaria bicolor S238N-H82]|uniref:Predicted protein n=1 Tax=Laccaria bicolor (strain S238N-H82 / ATCC MYA-4686) TaxID=486041 RepID=B0D894_LACBS|nr:uncharacterized protein LACBIDRAFT_296219 [Laccaria bicolor S238N-H82]EDR09041.1 predicted protein [Laccaria bicolor S238N-H82]|eukprot:XP_001880354.1 predicted protein [Laccaria bicolor S238N-H82]